MKVILFLLSSFFFVGNSVADSIEDLNKAFELRVKDPNSSSLLLDNLNDASFRDTELVRFNYLLAYHTALDGDIDGAFIELNKIETNYINDKELLIAILSTKLSVASGIRSWSDSFKILSELEQELSYEYSQIPLRSRQDALLGMGNFFKEIGEYDRAISLLSPLLTQPLLNASQCQVLTFLLGAYVNQAEISKSREIIQRYRDVCAPSSDSIYSNIVDLYILKLAWQNEQNEGVLLDALAIESEFILTGYTPGVRSLQAFIAEMALVLNEKILALEYALKVIGKGSEEGYYKPTLKAYEIAAEVHAVNNEQEQALQFLYKYIKLNQLINDNGAALQLAIQKAKFDVEKVKSEVGLLDGENKLLYAKAELSKARMEKTVLALVLSVLLVCILLYWSWRSKKIQKKLKLAAEIDYLTNIPNRSFFTQNTLNRLERNRNKRVVSAIILLDLDHFKRINDSYGHQVGDWTLKAVARTLSDNLKKQSGFVARIGGEEFALFLENCNSDDAVLVAENCRNMIEAIDTISTKHSFVITASFGVSDTHSVGYNFDNLMSAADLALYQSKRKGRNKVYEYSNNLSFSEGPSSF